MGLIFSCNFIQMRRRKIPFPSQGLRSLCSSRKSRCKSWFKRPGVLVVGPTLEKTCAQMLSSVVSDSLWPYARLLCSSVPGIILARMLEWVAISSFGGSSPSRDQTQISVSLALAGRFFTTSATWEALVLALPMRKSATSKKFEEETFIILLLNNLQHIWECHC